MANSAFSTSPIHTLTAQPAGSGEKFYARSSQAADAGNLTVTGLVAATPTSETNALIGRREKLTTATFTSLSQALLSAAQTGLVSIFGAGSGVAGVGSIIVTTQPANNDTIKIGLTGFEQTYTFKTTLTGAANEVKIGADASATAANLNAAINAGAGSGTTYGTGTAANAYVSSTVVGQSITITDKLKCARQLAWSISQTTGATLSIVLPQGGTDGTLLAQLAAGVTQVYDQITFDTENIATVTLPAKVAPVTDPIAVNGKSCTLRFKSDNAGDPISLGYQTSTDALNWATGLTAIADLSDSMGIDTPQFVTPEEVNIDFIRLVFTANTNTGSTAVDARVIY